MSLVNLSENIIPIMHCFDNNYVIPAAVAFYSMLEKANKNYKYKLYVLHSNITQQNQKLLFETIKKFSNATLEFIDMNYKFGDLFQKTKVKGHFSKEIYYKFIAPSIFPQYNKIIVTDVDVVYVNDISKCFEKFDVNTDSYVLGEEIRDFYDMKFKNSFYKRFTQEEISKLLIGAGFMVYNLKKMREDRVEEKLINFAQNNLKKVCLPEQDTINLVCYPNIDFFPKNTMFEVCKIGLIEPKADNIIQLHYSTSAKPWRCKCQKADIWYEYLLKTPFFDSYLDYLEKKRPLKMKTIFDIKLPFYKKKIALVKLPN